MQRSLQKPIIQEMSGKMVIILGPRQCGKTTLSKMLNASFDYFNYDFVKHRLELREMSWDRDKEVIIFDEIHKMKLWKSWLKGIYDVEGNRPNIVVTGSAKLDAFKKVGDSLAGRFFQFNLHPIDIKEAIKYKALTAEESYERLLTVSGFPEPFLKAKKSYYNRWKKSHLDVILKEDLLELSNIRDIRSIETLIELLKQRVGSPLSIRSLSIDLQRDPKTVKRWIEVLENLYVIFRIKPFHKNVARSLLKEAKIYFYDTAMLDSDEGIKLENITACSLLKECHFQQNVKGEGFELNYLRNKDGDEIDFLVTHDKKPHTAIEVKLSDQTPSKAFKKLIRFKQPINMLQIVRNLEKVKSYPSGVKIKPALEYLETVCF